MYVLIRKYVDVHIIIIIISLFIFLNKKLNK
jgi:hypothetical protein